MEIEHCCCNCAYCKEINPIRYFESKFGEEYQGYCNKTGIYLLTTDDRLCDKFEVRE